MAEKKMREAVLEFAEERFGTKPEYLWSRTPDCGVLRCGNNKWYAIIMNVDGRKIGLPDTGKLDIINVKCSHLMTGSLLAMKGIVPAYHMNKNNWVSVLLDGSVDIGQVTALLEMSHELVDRTKKKAKNAASE
ncbi:MAG: MmcQ/YjbR family DNA-binding protein [Ruminococcus sp.]|uniref:MmcQ/YjbR family DNA-binding protein n=1 Tax=Ruminococcus sp. TaxID=41978 RepID=UPI0025CFFE1F|nr:MmcQ/YjbR family DNA-binding protein [Ruminococcus sp.]MCR5601441.1 MmcQ/YjbR family DNA-binding protein [Ruminococcus sp.]